MRYGVNRIRQVLDKNSDADPIEYMRSCEAFSKLCSKIQRIHKLSDADLSRLELISHLNRKKRTSIGEAFLKRLNDNPQTKKRGENSSFSSSNIFEYTIPSQFSGPIPTDLEEHILSVIESADDVVESLKVSLLKVIEFTQRKSRFLNLHKKAIGTLELNEKVLDFNLEMTRRERDRYRDELEKGEG